MEAGSGGLGAGAEVVEDGVVPLRLRGWRGPLPASVVSEDWLLQEQHSPLGPGDPVHLVSDMEVRLRRD